MKEKKKKRVFVAMSGGVDSSVTALLLKKTKKYDLVGCFIKGWYPQGISCTWKEDRRDAMRVCAKLDIPFITIDAEKEYKKEVVDYMIREYKAGRTPNPDVMCNKHVKFGIFLKKALKMGLSADRQERSPFIATGHYVKVSRSRENAFFHPGQQGKACLPARQGFQKAHSRLLVARDLNKDQSYFLWALTQKQLKHCLFPIGDLTKPEVRKIAKKNGLITAEKKESMGVCFIGEFKMEDFLKKYIKPKKGKAITSDGKVACPTERFQSFRQVGEHNGVHFYTIGQRHGFSDGGGIPYYVVEKDIKKNLLIVADGIGEKKFYKKEIEISKINWISGIEPSLKKNYKARIRYRQPLQSCKIKKTKLKNYKVIFTKPQRAVTSGQSLVLYSGKKIVGGGIIK